MGEFIDLLVRFVPSPIWVPLFLAGWFVLPPAQAVVWRRVEAALERSISSCTNNVLNRLAILIVALTSAAGLFASLWCYAFTNLPPPMVDPKFQEPLGPFAARLHGYSVVWICSMMPFLGYLGGACPRPEPTRILDPIECAARKLPFAVLFTLVPCCLWITYSAFYNPTPASSVPLPPLNVDVLMWWCSWLPMATVGSAIFAYLVYKLFGWLWRLTAYMA